MIARGFKPVGWVAGVAGAALSCYMLSLNVAAERAELAKLERGIIMAKQDIRSLQTELGTRGRLQQLESWNANVLALSAPTSAQFLDNELTLARFDQREKTMEERAVMQMAAAEAPKPQPKIEAPVRYAAAPAARQQPLVHRASLTVAEPKPAAAPKTESKPAPLEKAEPKLESAKKEAAAPKLAKKEASAPTPAAPAKKKAALIDDDLVKSIGAAAKEEKSGGAGAR